MWLALFGTLFGSLLSGIWIAIALALTAIVIMHYWGPGLSILGNQTWEAINIYGLTSLPAFIFMGLIIEKSGISERIYSAASPLMARLPGKLLHSNVLVSAMFAAVLGSSTANCAVVGSVAIPELRKRKYNDRLILGTICVSGTLAQMIPPSGAMIIYGVVVGESIAALFAAGTIPGILLALSFMTYIGIKGLITPSIAPIDEKALPLKESLVQLSKIWPLIILMILAVGPIYAGWATTVEGAGIGSLASIIVGKVFGKLNWQGIKDSLMKTVETSSMIFFLIIGAMLLAASISTLGAPKALVEWVGNLPFEPLVILVLVYVFYLILGCFLDGISMMLLTLPFIVPIMTSLGFDKLFFGIVMLIVADLGLVTPPVGMNLFVVQAITGPKTSLTDIVMGSMPFLGMSLVVVAFCTAFPELIYFFPRLMKLW